MADVLISDLAAAGALADADLLEVEQGTSPSNTSGKIALSALLAFFCRRKVSALTISAGVVNIDLNGGANRDFTLVLTANVTSITFSNLPASTPAPGYVGEIEVQIKQDGTGGRTVALPAAFKALGGSDTAVASAANAVTVLSAKTWDQGTSWRYAMQESA